MSINLRLVPPAAAGLPAPHLSADQRAAVERPAGNGPLLVLGAPGTGKSTVLVETAVQRIERGGLDPAGVLLLAPSRLAAAALRDALSARLERTISAAPARTWASYAFDVIRRAKAEGLLPHVTRAPKLLSGAEQDVIIKELLGGHGQNGVPQLPWPESLSLALGTRAEVTAYHHQGRVDKMEHRCNACTDEGIGAEQQKRRHTAAHDTHRRHGGKGFCRDLQGFSLAEGDQSRHRGGQKVAPQDGAEGIDTFCVDVFYQ